MTYNVELVKFLLITVHLVLIITESMTTNVTVKLVGSTMDRLLVLNVVMSVQNAQEPLTTVLPVKTLTIELMMLIVIAYPGSSTTVMKVVKLVLKNVLLVKTV